MSTHDSLLDTTDQLASLIPHGSGARQEYQVLARKYRPDQFADLIGQETLINTLEQAFKTGRISHAFMLTGVRGVGKTTTARLLARALNFCSKDSTINTPYIDLSTDGVFCDAIRKGTHPDVLELDAASKTGVADMRDMLDNARYAPTSARYRVYVIDEVHMLSNHAFNALLKTLEEPPAHVKFIFATTEIQKVPVTILSRCQRFDLRRLSVDALSEHLQKIARLEGGNVESEGLLLLAQAAEGSVRDGLSLLDQALLQAQSGGDITTEAIRDMLGLIDEGESLAMLGHALNGNAKSALQAFDTLLTKGGIAEHLIHFCLSAMAEIASAQVTGKYAQDFVPKQILTLVETLDASLTSRLWKLLLEGYIDLKRAPDPVMAARMVLIRLSQAAKLPSPEALMKALGNAPAYSTPQGQNFDVSEAQATQEPTTHKSITSFSDILDVLDTRANARLVLDLRRYIKPVSCGWGDISCGLAKGAPDKLIQALKTALEDITKIAWNIQLLTQTSSATQAESEAAEKETYLNALRQDPNLKHLLAEFPNAEIISVQPLLH